MYNIYINVHTFIKKFYNETLFSRIIIYQFTCQVYYVLDYFMKQQVIFKYMIIKVNTNFITYNSMLHL